jgi:hypothetical protein
MDKSSSPQVPLTLNLAEYRIFFQLTESDLSKNILDFPRRINNSAEMFQGNYYAVAGDEACTRSLVSFKSYTFDLLLSSFFLFLQPESVENIWEKLMEMLRVATEVRIYPLPSNKVTTDQLGALMLKLQQNNFGIEIRSIVAPGWPNAGMLRIWSQNCSLK